MHSLQKSYLLIFLLVALACVAFTGCGGGSSPASGNSAAAAVVTSASLTFGNQTLHTTSPAASVTLTNTGSASLAVAAVTTSGDFAQTNNCGATLPAGASCNANVTFTPTALGNRTGTLSFADNSAQSPQVVRLYGSSVSAATLAETPSSVSFGTVTVGQASSQTVAITNNGGQSIDITSASTSGAGIGLSGISTPVTLAAGESLAFNVTFNPPSSGPVSGNVTLANDSATPNVTIPVAGTGGAAATNSHQVVLAWDATTSPVLGYNTYRATTSGGPYTKLSSSPTPTTSYTDQDVQAGNTYFYVVTSIAADMSESAYSNQAEAIVP